MSSSQTPVPSARRPLRLWPGVVAVALLWIARFGVKLVVPGFGGFRTGMLAALVAALLVVVWWLFLSRAPIAERFGVLALMAAALYLTARVAHESMGPLWLLGYAVPVLCLALVAGAALTRGLSDGRRRAGMAAVIVLACGFWLLLRTEGITGDHAASFRWRWAPSAEERLLAAADGEPAGTAIASATPVDEAAWPGFRGSERDGVVRGTAIATDWSTSPPVELWRRPVGPGWSSFAVAGELLYTQEQRGDDEVVASYRLATGEPVWIHHDPVRFFESNGGPGPRATPTVSGGRVYTLGATGVVNALDALSGERLWSRDVTADTADTDASIPTWGFSGSPAVVGDLVVVPAAGRLVAYDRDTGAPRWIGPADGVSYASPQRLDIDGVAHLVHLGGSGATGYSLADGEVLWKHPWEAFPIVQPNPIAGGDLLLAVGGEAGVRRISVEPEADGWSARERWTSTGLKPYFSDFVVHDGHAYGFDHRILASVELAGGERVWKGGRYGSGQLVLLADQDLLLVLSEKGELALVAATPDRFTELARVPAIEGKTWNHPVVVGDVVLVRNGREMAAFRLPSAGA